MVIRIIRSCLIFKHRHFCRTFSFQSSPSIVGYLRQIYIIDSASIIVWQDMPDSEYKVEILEDGPIKKIAVNGKIYEVDYNMGGDSIHSIIIDHHSHGVQISPSSNNSYTIMNKGELYQIELQGEMEKIHNARTAAESVGRQVVQAPMPGVILKTYVKKGDSVKRGDPLCVLVAMKMENEIRSVTDGVVKEVFVEDGMKVGLNDRIMVIE